MSTRPFSRSLVPAALFVTLIAGLASAQATSGTISGRITDANNGQPIPLAQVNVIGTNLGVQTNAEGRYTLRGVKPGQIELRVLRVGFTEQRRNATVSPGQTLPLDIQMGSIPITLSPVVTTETGSQRRVELGNSIAQVDASKIVAQTGVRNMGDLLTARAAGVTVYTPTQIGAGTRIRIRGTSSLSLSNNPIYVIDGIRAEGTTGSGSIGVGGTLPSRVNDLNPDEIESIEIVRGPSAATIYGTSAANGVIVITTKKGITGSPRFTYFTEQGANVDRNTYPTAYRGWQTGTTAATTSSAANTVQCFLSARSAGTCKQDSVTSFNLYEDPETTPNGVGYRQLHGLQVRGGSETFRYFLHGEWMNDNGVLKVPDFDERYMAAHGRTLRPEEASPNHQDAITTRANFNLALSPKADLSLSMGYISSDLRLPTSDDSGVNGVAGNTYGGPGFKYNTAANGDTLYGWRQVTPRDVYQTVTGQGIKRMISSLNGNYRPFEWLSTRGVFGVDYINRLDTQLCRFGNCPDLGGDSKLGFKTDNRTNFFSYTASGSAAGTKQLTDALLSRTTFGLQFSRNIFDRNGSNGVRLAPGATTLSGAAVKAADEATDETRTLGAFVEEHLAFSDRLYVTGAVRSDRNSAFGKNFKTVFYPNISASWVVSQENFFPKTGSINNLRLRAAYGASGVQPGTTDAQPFYSATTVRGEAADAPAVVFSTLGNANLKPERSTEFEGGIDGAFFSNRVTTELTFYNKISKDALIQRVLPPSLGTGSTSRFENLGEVRNKGIEALLGAQLLQSNALGWDATLTYSHNDNKIKSLGGLPPLVNSSTQQNREGYPLNGWWARRLTGFADANGDGIITLSEITVTDTAVFIGYTLPTREATFTNGFDLFSRRVRVGAMIDYKGGHKMYNNTERIRCASRLNCSGLINPSSSLFEQARTVLVREHVSKSAGEFIEDGDFIRFRELNFTITGPERWASKFMGSRSISATFAVRNLGVLWTKYTGVDPEAIATTGDAPSEFQAFPPPTYYSLRLSFGF
ncbi:MAG TPA: SusC/RagA family TonB-linked outer membrane protein [Gemmatimonadaceae bacterium]|nr:SusC/RagA family TonB-linked outer membrane protein [Gemmatimonadaceae bacterium]